MTWAALGEVMDGLYLALVGWVALVLWMAL